VKIALLSESKTGINIFSKLREKLSAKIADAEIEEHFVPSPEDLPLKAKELTESNAIVFVFSLYPEKDSSVEMLVEKLVDIELETGKKIVKAIEQSEIEDISTEEQLDEERDRLAEKWADTIVKILFSPKDFAPNEELPENPSIF